MESLAMRLSALAEPLTADAGLDLVDLQVKGVPGRRLVRVIVDRKGGVTLGACQGLSNRLSDALDAADVVEGRYSLEVTSPGVDHPLHGQRDFDRVEGRAVLVHRDAGDGRVVQLRGTVARAGADEVVLEAGGDIIAVPYQEIVKAAQTLPW